MDLITGALLAGFASSLAPIFFAFGLGSVYTWLNVLKQDFTPAFSIYIHWIGLPALMFRRLALFDLKDLDLSLLKADAVSKLIPLILLLLWWRFFSKLDRIKSIEWLIVFFMLCTIPNTVLIGDQVLTPMFKEDVQNLTTTIIFGQSLYWYNCIIVLLEIREMFLEDERIRKKAGVNADKIRAAKQQKQLEALLGEWSKESVVAEAGAVSAVDKQHDELGALLEQWSKEDSPVQHEHTSTEKRNYSRVQDTSIDSTTHLLAQVTSIEEKLNHEHSITLSNDSNFESPKQINRKLANSNISTKLSLAVLTAVGALQRILRVPLLYGSSLGFVWSMHGWPVPTYMHRTVNLCADGTIGMAMVLLGVSFLKNVRSPKGVIPCGYKLLFAGFAARFLVAPLIMFMSTLPFSIKGINLSYAILQVIVPQGSMTFALARIYNCKVNIMSTAIYIQMIVFMPIMLAYYVILQKISGNITFGSLPTPLFGIF